MKRPELLVSYAQNHEDVVLARLFQPWNRKGHWIDVGAGHPTFDSVTKLFSDFGWTGINVEPLEEEFNCLQNERPLDVNIKCAIDLCPGERPIYEGPPESRGTSSLKILSSAQHEGIMSIVETRTLDQIMKDAPWPIDFIKIDVEGMEEEVLKSADWSKVTASVIVVEATAPNSTDPTHDSWEHILLEAGFESRLFDGLNRFYENSRNEIAGRLSWFPATVQDRFVGVSEFALQMTVRDLRQSVLELERYVASLKLNLTSSINDAGSAASYARTLEVEIEKLEVALSHSEATRHSQDTTIADLKQRLLALHHRFENL